MVWSFFFNFQVRRETADGTRLTNAFTDRQPETSLASSTTQPTDKQRANSKMSVGSTNARSGESAESRANRNVTLMLIMTWFLNVVGNVPYVVGTACAYIGIATYFSYVFTVTLLYIYPSLKIATYFLFNKQ